MLDTALTRKGSAFDAWLTSIAQRLLASGWTPNAITGFALAAGVSAGWLFFRDHDFLGFVAMLASGLLDAVDGRMARLGPGPTPWGGVMDLIFDRIVEASILLGIALPRPELHVAALVVAVTWYINISVFFAVGAASEKYSEKVIFYPPGLLERGESLLFAFIVIVFPSWALLACSVYAVLEIITAAQRFRYGHQALS